MAAIINSSEASSRRRAGKIEQMRESNESFLDCVIQETGPEPARVIIWLHGLGADGHDFAPIVPQLIQTTAEPVRFVFPHAPVRPVTINNGMAMRAWYDILGMQIDRDQDRQGIEDSIDHVNRLIQREISNGIAPDRIALVGFSQGGAMALRTGLAQQQGLAAVVGLSCYLLQADQREKWLSSVGRQTPVFLGHGSVDPVVPIALGQHATQALQQSGIGLHWQHWPIAHGVSPDEIITLDHWLASQFEAAVV
ncbi:MAG: dienelactone hydrolase family protein [Pseudomonadota bacterium]